uniref:Uncharacterized protein n=1 Tax=Ditylenchus dipsaci TaxID=166011 RepID=A0A915D0C9_9BILA
MVAIGTLFASICAGLEVVTNDENKRETSSHDFNSFWTNDSYSPAIKMVSYSDPVILRCMKAQEFKPWSFGAPIKGFQMLLLTFLYF